MWRKYFDECRDLRLSSGDSFRIYQTTIDPTSEPIGTKLKVVNDAATSEPLLQPLFILHHGGGHTALTWATMVGKLRQLLHRSTTDSSSSLNLPKTPIRLLAYDCRGHGQTRTSDDSDLSLQTLAQDLHRVISQYSSDETVSKGGNCIQELVLVGHSMGGAVVVEYAKNYANPNTLLGICMIDVVEGTAMDALTHMRGFLTSRPQRFASEHEAIQWSIRSGQVRNEESATVSIPAQLFSTDGGEGWVEWRTNLLASEPYWQEWFAELSEKFLQIRAAKLLIVAGTDRLDKPLTIGQIQGKFQMIVMPQCGHCIQEDDPAQTARGLWDFYYRNSRNNLPLVLRKKLLMMNAT